VESEKNQEILFANSGVSMVEHFLKRGGDKEGWDQGIRIN